MNIQIVQLIENLAIFTENVYFYFIIAVVKFAFCGDSEK